MHLDPNTLSLSLPERMCVGKMKVYLNLCAQTVVPQQHLFGEEMWMGRHCVMHVVYSKLCCLLDRAAFAYLYFFNSLKLHHEKRPLSMKTDNIKKRQRCDNGNSMNKSISSTASSHSQVKKKNRTAEEPLTTTVTFDTKFEYTNHKLSPTEDSDYTPFNTFGLTLTHQPI